MLNREAYIERYLKIVFSFFDEGSVVRAANSSDVNSASASLSF